MLDDFGNDDPHCDCTAIQRISHSRHRRDSFYLEDVLQRHDAKARQVISRCALRMLTLTKIAAAHVQITFSVPRTLSCLGCKSKGLT